MDQYIGKFLDNRYELLELIGSGGMAQVYRARCHRLNRLVAVKILRSDLAQDADFRRRFHDESQAVAMLSHPNIMAVYDVSRTGDVEYIVMELIDGITLKQYMKKRGVLNWRESLHFITQIMKGLSHAHSRGIIHRDIKPHNIMVLRDGSVKVTDFGIARLASSAQNTLTQEALGSVHYISPEQAKGSRVDARSDIYSAGVVLYEMTTGRLPFEGDSAVSVAIQHINSMPLSPRELNPEIPEALEKIILKAMAPLPDDRYASAEDMLADLEEFRKNPNVNFEYEPSFLMDEIQNEPTRKIPVSTVNSHTGHTGEGYLPPRPPQHPEPAAREPLPRKKRKKKSGNGFLIAAIAAVILFVIGIGFFLWTFVFSGMFAPTADLEVPKLIGQTLEEVQANKDYAKFNIVEGPSVTNTAEAGEIVDQDPAAGRKVKEGATITVTISSGGETVEVQDVLNLEKEEALRILERQGFQTDTKYEESESVTKDYVVATSPKAGTPLAPGETVTVTISLGPTPTTVLVPPLVGLTESKAVNAIEKLGLEVGNITTEPNETEAGLVFYQSIPTGTEVAEGISINLKVSEGPEEETETSTPSAAESGEPEQTPPVSHTTAPSTEPTAAQPTTTGAEQQPVSKSFSVKLPDGDGTVRVQILVNGESQYEQTVDRTNLDTIYPTLTGTGTCIIEVYFDGALSASTTVDFTS